MHCSKAMFNPSPLSVVRDVKLFTFRFHFVYTEVRMMEVARWNTTRVVRELCSEPSRKVTKLIEELSALEPSIALSALVAIISATHICNMYNQRIQGKRSSKCQIDQLFTSYLQ